MATSIHVELIRISLDSNIDVSPVTRPIKCAKLKSSDDLSNLTKTTPLENCTLNRFHSHLAPAPPLSSLSSSSSSPSSVSFPSTATVALPLSCLINPDLQQAPQQSTQTTHSPSFTVDFNTLKANGMNIIFAPSSSNSSQSSPPSNIPLVLTFGNLPYPPS